MDFGIKLVAYGQATATLALRCGCRYEEWSDPATGETAASLWNPCGEPEHEPRRRGRDHAGHCLGPGAHGEPCRVTPLDPRVSRHQITEHQRGCRSCSALLDHARSRGDGVALEAWRRQLAAHLEEPSPGGRKPLSPCDRP